MDPCVRAIVSTLARVCTCTWPLLSVQMTFGDAMRNKARLSITGSTGENGRVMTPEFPKAVHAVPYVRPDMGLNVSLTDLSWSTRNFWVPYNGFNIVIFLFFCFCPSLPPTAPTLLLSLSGENGKVGKWRVSFCLPQRIAFLLSVSISRRINLPPNPPGWNYIPGI